jgi:hypothetical protein
MRVVVPAGGLELREDEFSTGVRFREQD